MLFAVSYPPLEVPPVSEAPAFPSNFVETAQTLDRATIDALRDAVALGRWPNGARLSKEQQGLCLEAVLAWEHRHLPPEEHTGYVPSPQDACGSAPEAPAPLRWLDDA